MKYPLFLLMLLFSLNAAAFCPIADAAAKKNGMDFAIPLYIRCALSKNDDETQLMLARFYQKQQKNTTQSLFYYHLSADNGNAMAQTELAELLLKMDKNPNTRMEILNYYKTTEEMNNFNRMTGFKSLRISPYALLFLANEPAEKKWYYPSKTKSDPTASRQLKNYSQTISEAKKNKALQEVQAFKNKKVIEAAQTLLTPAEYQTFQAAVFPQAGVPDAFTAKQQIDLLKERIKGSR